LPDLDLARIAPLSREQKRRELEKLKLKFPPYSYNPMRRSILDILHVEPGPLTTSPRTSWNQIEAGIRRCGRTEDETEANLLVAKALYLFADEEKIAGRREEFYPLPIGVSEKVTFWLPAVISVSGTTLVPLVDPRRGERLTDAGKLVAFSMMHERIRAADPDFAAVALGIFQFTAPKNGPRLARLFLDTGLKLIDFDTLDAMVRETYQIWHEVLEERRAEERRKGGGGSLI
jgi:hypothetical protein